MIQWNVRPSLVKQDGKTILFCSFHGDDGESKGFYASMTTERVTQAELLNMFAAMIEQVVK
jgi:hypothetical protein